MIPPRFLVQSWVILTFVRQVCRYFRINCYEIQRTFVEYLRHPVQARALTRNIFFVLQNFGACLPWTRYCQLYYVAILRWHITFHYPPVLRRALKAKGARLGQVGPYLRWRVVRSFHQVASRDLWLTIRYIQTFANRAQPGRIDCYFPPPMGDYFDIPKFFVCVECNMERSHRVVDRHTARRYYTGWRIFTLIRAIAVRFATVRARLWQLAKWLLNSA
jgi:hypothetical protein